jgi:hypothetical protein
MPSISGYAMCYNNPVLFKDMFGLYPIWRNNSLKNRGWWDFSDGKYNRKLKEKVVKN